jgi:hypothetical protein
VFLFPIKKKTGPAIREPLMQLMNTYDVGAVMADNGTEFKNKELTAFSKSRGVKERHVMSYSGASNGVVEAKNKQVRKFLRKLFIKYETDKWPKLLPEVATLMNNQFSRTTRQIPKIMYEGPGDEEKVEAYKERVQKRVDDFQDDEFDMAETVRISLKSMSSGIRRMIEDKDSKHIVVHYTPGIYHIAKVIQPRNNGLDRRRYVLSDLHGNLVRVSKKKSRRVAEFYGSDLISADIEDVTDLTLTEVMKMNGLKNDIRGISDEEVDEEEVGDDQEEIVAGKEKEVIVPTRTSRTNKKKPSRFNQWEMSGKTYVQS